MRWMVSRGWHGWALVLIVVVVFDVFAATLGGESMTDAMRRWFGHGIGRWFVLALLVYLVAHLTVLPWRYDPLDRAYVWLRGKTHQPPEVVELPQHLPGGQG
jgi:hypothetical protein